MAAPWDKAPPEDQWFVLVTGANSGVGLGIGQRLIDDFLAQRSASSHLILIITTRSSRKSQETVYSLRKHAKRTVESSTVLRSRIGPSYRPADALRRIHILSIQLDLCTLPSVYKAADQLINGALSSPSDDPAFEPLDSVRIPRLDSAIFNAGMGGWTGLNWLLVFKCILTTGLIQSFTYPTFKDSTGGLLVDPLDGKPTTLAKAKSSDRLMGEVFCANVFGHYIFGHELLPLLGRTADSKLPPGRIIWESSVEAFSWDNHSLDDFQGLRTIAAYESTKRLTDVLALTADLPGVRPYSAPYFRCSDSDSGNKNKNKDKNEKIEIAVPPRHYLAHPGVVVTTMFPLNVFLFYAYKLAMYIARWLGSPWHTVRAYTGAAAPVWLALQPQPFLDAVRAERAKWGSGASRWAGASLVKKSEVEGWGWEGAVVAEGALERDDGEEEEEEETGLMRKRVGRKSGAADTTRERLEEFEALGAQCWREMERLRGDWEERLGAHREGS
ncbi:uncharacterized protein E0L32_001366 [Thyridium curvatum]|uniref:3-keto-steroid reductase n=1 Tax=Thyridium curvatum TaxID=1093900 RepID=A0A507AYR9_9PEZI|nr:uncharacterized protein E0L32_001366 [Thyridium curvatum]TPX10169.1 hypothetical protein E0L32_001366 [Thyridium curvatum]